MKKLFGVAILAGSLVASISANAHDHNPPGGADCGMLGSQMMKGKSGVVNHIVGFTVNGTFAGSALYGITTGTLGCDTSKNISPIYASFDHKKSFVAANYDRIAQDAANGSGSYLAAYASLVGLEDQDKPVFFSLVKEQYSSFFTEKSNAADTVKALDQAMVDNSQLTKYFHSH